MTKKIAIIGGIAMMSFGAGNMIMHKHKPKIGPNELAIATGAIVLSFGITIRFWGGLAHLARAPALHAGGHQFDSDILHV